jgi:hypothetical protein
MFSLWKGFQAFLEGFGTPEASQVILDPIESAPRYIAAWIFQKCERPDVKNPQTASCQGASFSYALKMRATVSYHFAQQVGRGSEKWHQDRQGVWIGNPALSHEVSRYMISLQRRKVNLLQKPFFY